MSNRAFTFLGLDIKDHAQFLGKIQLNGMVDDFSKIVASSRQYLKSFLPDSEELINRLSKMDNEKIQYELIKLNRIQAQIEVLGDIENVLKAQILDMKG